MVRAPQRQLLPPVRHCSVFHGDALLQQTGAQSVSNTPPPTGTSGFTHQDLVLGTTRPQRAPERSHHFLPWGHLAPTLGCEGRMCPSLTCVGRGPGGRWLCAQTHLESPVPGPSWGLSPHPTQGASVLTLRAQHQGLLAGCPSWDEGSRGGPGHRGETQRI